jgi:hypothetical protein
MELVVAPRCLRLTAFWLLLSEKSISKKELDVSDWLAVDWLVVDRVLPRLRSDPMDWSPKERVFLNFLGEHLLLATSFKFRQELFLEFEGEPKLERDSSFLGGGDTDLVALAFFKLSSSLEDISAPPALLSDSSSKGMTATFSIL